MTAPTSTTNPISPVADADHSAQANLCCLHRRSDPSDLPVQDSIIHRNEIAVETYGPIPLSGVERNGQLFQALVVIGTQPVYRLKGIANGEIICLPRYLDGCQVAANHCQPFVDSLAGLSDTERVRQLDFYICNRMTHEHKGADIGNILSQDGVVQSYCMDFSYCLQFLCGMADIPCILVASNVHMRKEVCAGSQWWGVDVVSNNSVDEQGPRDHLEVLLPARNFQDSISLRTTNWRDNAAGKGAAGA